MSRENEDSTPLFEGFDRLPSGAFETPTPSDDFHDTVLARTSRVVKWRRLRTRLLQVAAAVAIYIAGAASGFILDRGREPTVAPIAEVPRPDDPALDGSTLPRDPRALEPRLLEAAPEVQEQKWKEAGDLYLLSDRSDPEAALYCYRRLLAQA